MSGDRPRDTRFLRILPGLILAVAALASAQTGLVVVEDWSKHLVGARGIPDGWKGQNWGSPAYDLTVIEGSPKTLHLKSHNEGSTIIKEVKINVKETPILEWQWKAVGLPAGGDSRKKAADDQAAQLYVTFPRFPSAGRPRPLGYVWDTTAPQRTILHNQKT